MGNIEIKVHVSFPIKIFLIFYLFDISELSVQEVCVTNFNHILYTPN